MSANSLWGALLVTIIGGLVVERCKGDLRMPEDTPAASIQTVVVPIAQGSVREFVPQERTGELTPQREQAVAQTRYEAPREVPEEHAGGMTMAELPSRPSSGMVEAGTTFRVTANERVCTHTHGDGATFTGQLAEYVAGSNGVGIAPGATVRFAVRSRRDGDAYEWTIEPRTLATANDVYELQASASRYPMRRVSRGRDRAIGAGVGALVGLVGAKAAGRSDEEAAAVAMVGGVAGGALASGSQSCLSDAGVIDVTLDSPVTLPAR